MITNEHFEVIEHQKPLQIKLFFHNLKRSTLHWHDDIELLLVLKGTINVLAVQKTHILQQNDLIYINPNQLHSSIGLGDSNLVLALQIDPNYIKRYSNDFKRKKFRLYPQGKDHCKISKKIGQLMGQMMLEYRQQLIGYEFKVESYLNEIIAILLRETPFEKTNNLLVEGRAERKDVQDRIKRILNFIDDNYFNRITLSDIAKREGISKSYLSRYFKEQIGCGLIKYLNHLRLYKSIAPLMKMDKNITEIALNQGFSDVRSYISTFKQNLGTTPTEFRKQIITKGNEISNKQNDWYGKVDRQNAITLLKAYLKT